MQDPAARPRRSWPRWPDWDDTDLSLLAEVLESGAWSSAAGDQVNRWAADFASFQSCRHGLGVTNGSHALEAALAACGVGEGDEVIVPALTFVASATAALAVNATPVLVDVDAGSLCIDPAAAEDAVTERTRAIIAVHVAGAACDLDALVELCDRRGIVLIEDCAHAHGTRWRGRGVGSFGSFGTFSFEISKLMTAGEGGALVTNDDELRSRAWSYVNCGRVEGGFGYHHATYGTNLRMTEWQGALLRAQLQRLPAQHRVREERAKLLDAEIAKLGGLRPQATDPRIDSRARYCYVLHYDADEFAGLSRGGFERALAAEGILVVPPYPSLDDVELFRSRRFEPRLRESASHLSYDGLSLDRARHASATTVWLDHRMLLAEPEDVLDVPRAISRIQEHAEAVARADRRRSARNRIAGAARRLKVGAG